MATSSIEHTSYVRTALCTIQAVTSKGKAEVSPSITIKQILAAGNLSYCQDYLMDIFLEAECFEEKLDEQLKDSMFIVFPTLDAFPFKGNIIRREEP